MTGGALFLSETSFRVLCDNDGLILVNPLSIDLLLNKSQHNVLCQKLGYMGGVIRCQVHVVDIKKSLVEVEEDLRLVQGRAEV